MLRPCFAVIAGVIALAVAGVAAAQACPADCDGDTAVGVNELITCVGIVLAGGPTTACPPCDGDGDGAVAINEIIAGVNSALAGCPLVNAPDLAPVSARFRSTTPACINDTSEIQLKLEVCVANQGNVASGPFNVHVLGEPFGRIDGLGAGAQTCILGPFVPFSIDVQVDADNEIAELDEEDNFKSFFVPAPTPPPFCAATPTVTETPESTATATAADTDTPTVEPTSGDTDTPTVASTATETPTPEPSATPTETPQ